MAGTTTAGVNTITLYSSTISDCSARLRIGLNLKHLPYTLVDVNISRGEHLDPKYVNLNEAQTVPTLVIDQGTVGKKDDRVRVVLTQSIAALEYLDEAFPGTCPLLPPLSEPLTRAKVRTLVGIVATDIHPLTTHRLGTTIQQCFPCPQSETAKATGNRDWDILWITQGLKVYEKVATETAGMYSVGNDVTLADVVLLPELWMASRIGVDLGQYITISRIFKNLSELDGVQKAKADPSSELQFKHNNRL